MINTKDVKTGGGFVPKTLEPGNHTVTINNLEYKAPVYKKDALELVFQFEGPDMGEGFDGFWIDKNDQSLGKYKGQVARVKVSRYAFSDGTTPSGVQISRDNEILKFLKNLCIELDATEWFESQDGKHETIESLLDQFNKDKVYAGKKLDICISGKEYTNQQGYKAYDLFLPKYSKSGVPFEKSGKQPSKVAIFNKSEHIIALTTPEVAKSFEANEGVDIQSNDEFRL